MTELVRYLVSSLVEHPDAISIRETDDGETVTYHVIVDAADIGRVIGRQGRIAKAIRNLVSAAGYRQGKRVFVDIES